MKQKLVYGVVTALMSTLIVMYPAAATVIPQVAPCSVYRSTAERSLPYEICTKNSAIGRIQKALGLPKTGKFDAITFDKIVSFQASNSLQQTGKIDLATLDAIADFVDNGYGSTACKFNITRPNLPWKKCDYSPSIASFQTFLGLKADGYFGPGTETAVINFQYANNLSQTGIIDSSTWNAYKNPKPSTTTSTPRTNRSPSPTSPSSSGGGWTYSTQPPAYLLSYVCELKNSPQYSNWYGQQYIWTYYGLYSDGSTRYIKSGMGYANRVPYDCL
jgi:peptidoglycan hydrolase-like protein with peptidoglycan-binding domain